MYEQPVFDNKENKLNQQYKTKCCEIGNNRLISKGLPRWLSGKESAANKGDAGSIPGSGRSPRGGNGNPFQYSRQENPMDRGA